MCHCGCENGVQRQCEGRVCRGSAQSAREHAALCWLTASRSLSIFALPRDAHQAAARGHPGLLFTTPLRESARRHLQVGSGPQAAKQERNPASAGSLLSPALCGGLGPRNNLSLGEAAPSAWQCPVRRPWPQRQGPSRGLGHLRGLLDGPGCAEGTPTTLWLEAPTSPFTPHSHRTKGL